MKLWNPAMLAATLAITVCVCGAQDMYKECQSQVSARAGTSMSNVSTRQGPTTPDGYTVITWRARANGNDMRGYCMADPRSGQITNMQLGNYDGPVAGNGGYGGFGGGVPAWMIGHFSGFNGGPVSLDISASGQVSANVHGVPLGGSIRNGRLDMGSTTFYLDQQGNGLRTRQVGNESNQVYYTRDNSNGRNWNNNNGNWNNNGGGWGSNGNGSGWGNRTPQPPRVRADTSGNGQWSGPEQQARITRGFVDTTGQPSVSLRGSGFMITCMGNISGSNGDREFSFNIQRCDRGPARGTASFRLNGDHDEVEWIRINGSTSNGGSFQGEFHRN